MEVLYVDDHTDSLILFQHFLGDIPCVEVEVARNGKEAIEYVKRDFPSVIFLDYGLPDNNGIELKRKIKQIYNPFVFCITGYADTNSVEKLQKEFDSVIVKPCDYNEIKMLVIHCLERMKMSN